MRGHSYVVVGGIAGRCYLKMSSMKLSFGSVKLRGSGQFITLMLC